MSNSKYSYNMRNYQNNIMHMLLCIISLLTCTVQSQSQSSMFKKIKDAAIESSVNQIHNGHEYVDLGLSVMWATCNIGGTSPDDFGNYFAWGETTPKELYDWSTYKHYYEEYDLIVKYYNNYKNVLDLSDDAASIIWGGKWRLPTEAEWTELVENCTVEREFLIQAPHGLGQVGLGGFKFVSKINGNSIIFPFAGGAANNEKSGEDINGFYWSSSLYLKDPTKAWGLWIESPDVGGVAILLRAYGQSIRPVFSPYH